MFDKQLLNSFGSGLGDVRPSEYGFRYREIESVMSHEEQLQHLNTVAFNAIFFQLEGSLKISWGEHKNVIINAGDMYFLPRGANVSACIVSDHISYVVVRLDHNIANNKNFNFLNRIKEQHKLESYRFAPLAMNHQMLLFAESVKNYILHDVRSSHLSDIKFAELQIILRRCYTSAECVNMLSPIVGFNSEFEQYILNNYSTSTSIEELAAKANMSRSTFDRKFKETFDTTPLKWIDEQTRQRIIHKASEPNITVKDIMYEVEVYNPSQFTQLCKRLCGVTPTELIRIK